MTILLHDFRTVNYCENYPCNVLFATALLRMF